jgi:hypothetical protein
MPKQTSHGRAANRVTLQVAFDTLHCRYVHQVVRDVADNDRLRGRQLRTDVELRMQSRHDTVLRRVFSRKDIDSERAVVRASLAQAVANVTPERLKRMGSPGRQAVNTLRQAARLHGRHDVKAGQIRSAVMLLAGSRRQKSFMHTPVKPGRLAPVGAVGLQHGNMANWAQLKKFCRDSVANRDLLALLCTPRDREDAWQYQSMQSCILIFKSVALDYLMEARDGDEQKQLQRLWKTKSNAILQLFLQRWTEARQSGRIGDSRFAWVGGVEWLVGGLQTAARTDDAGDSRPTGMLSTGERPAQPAPSLKPVQTRQSATPPMRDQPLEKGRQSTNRWLQNDTVSPSSRVTSGRQDTVAPTSQIQAITNARSEQRSQAGATKRLFSMPIPHQVAASQGIDNARAGRLRGAVGLVAGSAWKLLQAHTPTKPARPVRPGTMEGTGLRHGNLARRRQAYPESPSRLAKMPLPAPDKKSTSSCMPDDTHTADNSPGPATPSHALLEMLLLAQVGKSASRNAVSVDNAALATGTDTGNLPETPFTQ